MGNWHISIRGVGHHHNTNVPTDANRLAAGFVKTLQESGHSIVSAAITHGAEEDLQWPYIGYGEPTPLAIQQEATPIADDAASAPTG